MLSNFNECWWDSIILDILICNWIGIWEERVRFDILMEKHMNGSYAQAVIATHLLNSRGRSSRLYLNVPRQYNSQIFSVYFQVLCSGRLGCTLSQQPWSQLPPLSKCPS